MAVGTHISSTLTGIKTQFESNMPTMLNSIESAASVTLTDPQTYKATLDTAGAMMLPALFVSIEGTVDHIDYLSQLTVDLEIPVLVSLIHHESDLPATQDAHSWHYAEAIIRVLTKHVYTNVSGVISVDVESSGVSAFGEDRNRRIVEVRASVLTRTDRSR